MQPMSEGPIDSWSDEELLARYREATLDRDRQEFGPQPQIADLEEEIQKRGLVIPDHREAGVHPESGEALPAAESLTGEPGVSPPIHPG
jgi:hypothetical protein